MAVGNLVDFVKEDGNLVIILLPEGREELAEMRESHPEWNDDTLFGELAERQLCNGWSYIDPPDIAALTNTTILTDDCSRDDHGNITALGRMYFDADYQIRSAVAEMEEKGRVTFTGV